QLLSFHSLAERDAVLSGRFSLWREGAVRCVMELRGMTPDDARAWISELASGGTTTKAFYRMLQDLAYPRMLVDKSPAYAMDTDALRRAERDFDGALYVHLVRHPYAMVRSFVDRRLDQVMLLQPHAFRPRELGELVWVVSHQNVNAFLRDVPTERWYRLRYEDLVESPRGSMMQLCERFGLPFHEGLLQPYRDLDRKMVGGVYAGSTPMGDPKFLEYHGIATEPAAAWQAVLTDDFLGDVTWALACEFGYDRAVAGAGRDGLRARDRTGGDRSRREEARRAIRAAEAEED
ncbi:MAG TPA: sulfotransferase, partial [Methylomirabilota bacterium]|nr:sulfotransferase [Methylomirabilota bacterium]